MTESITNLQEAVLLEAISQTAKYNNDKLTLIPTFNAEYDINTDTMSLRLSITRYNAYREEWLPIDMHMFIHSASMEELQDKETFDKCVDLFKDKTQTILRGLILAGDTTNAA